MNREPAPGRVRRALAAVAGATGLALVFGLAAAGSVLLHLGLPAPRRFVTARVNGVLAQTFKGKVTIQRASVLHLTRIDGVDAEVFDPEGKRVLSLQGVRARFGTVSLLRSLVGVGPLVVRITELTVNGAEAVLEDDASGEVGLLRAFDSREPSAPGRGIEVTIPAITLHHAWVHGHLAAAPIVDADLEELAGAFASTPKTTELEITHLVVRGRGLPGMSPEGEVQARLALPADTEDQSGRRARFHYEGRVGEIPVRADGSLTGKEVVAMVDVPETQPGAFTALAPGQIRLGAPVSAHAEVHGALPVLRPELRARIGDGELTASGTVTLPEGERTELVASAKLAVKDLDVSLLKEGAPRSRLTAELDAEVVSRPGGKLSGTFHLDNQVGEISGRLVPALGVRGDFTERGVRGAAQIAERGAPTSVQFSLQPREGGASPDQLALKVDATIPDLDGIARVGPIGRGRAHLVAEGGMDLETKRVSANASVELAGIDVKGVQLARGVVTGSAEGALASLHVVAKLLGTGMRAGGYAFTSVRAGVSGAPGDLEVTANLAGDAHAPTMAARARVADHGDLTVRGAVIDLHRGDVSSTARIAAVHVAGGTVDVQGLRIDGLGDPLEATARISASGVTVKAKAAGLDLHRAASLEADLELRELALDRTTFPRGKVHVGVKDGSISATARLEQADGDASLGVTGAMAWGAELAPHLDEAKPIEVAIHAKNFRADAAMPFVQGVFSELDGRIDAEATLHVDAGGKDGKMDGAVVIRDGVIEVSQLGERFHALRGRVIMKPWGTLRLEGLSAEAPTGKLAASAEAVVKGFALQSATGRMHIAKGQSIPIALEGVPMGRAYGDVTTTAKMSPDGKRLDVGVDIPRLHVDLPQATGHAVQPLEPDRTVHIGLHAGRSFVTLPLAPPEKPRAPSDLVVRAAIKLGNDVGVKRDTTVDVAVGGQVNVEVTDRARLTGRINLERGKLKLQGKVFTIDRATVSFVGGDPANPMVTATAYWDAPDATRVYAEFSGHVTSGKLDLRSEPSLSQDGILALILFGSPDGSLGAQPPPGQQESTGVKAVGMAGSVVTEGLNKAISGITTVDLTTRIDTSKADNPRPELAVQISKAVSARLGYKLGVPAPGENPDRTELTLDWRFIRNWSLVTVVGDQGSTALDVMWRMRY